MYFVWDYGTCSASAAPSALKNSSMSENEKLGGKRGYILSFDPSPVSIRSSSLLLIREVAFRTDIV